MAVDYGSRATGIAISDELRITVRPLTTLLTDRGKSKSTIDRIVALALEYNVATVVVGVAATIGSAIDHVGDEQGVAGAGSIGAHEDATAGVTGADVAGDGPERPRFIYDSSQR